MQHADNPDHSQEFAKRYCDVDCKDKDHPEWKAFTSKMLGDGTPLDPGSF
jgi:hypothetical protein